MPADFGPISGRSPRITPETRRASGGVTAHKTGNEVDKQPVVSAAFKRRIDENELYLEPGLLYLTAQRSTTADEAVAMARMRGARRARSARSP